MDRFNYYGLIIIAITMIPNIVISVMDALTAQVRKKVGSTDFFHLNSFTIFRFACLSTYFARADFGNGLPCPV